MGEPRGVGLGMQGSVEPPLWKATPDCRMTLRTQLGFQAFCLELQGGGAQNERWAMIAPLQKGICAVCALKLLCQRLPAQRNLQEQQGTQSEEICAVEWASGEQQGILIWGSAHGVLAPLCPFAGVPLRQLEGQLLRGCPRGAENDG